MKLKFKVARMETRNIPGVGPTALVKLKSVDDDGKPHPVEAEVTLAFPGASVNWHPEEREDGPNNTYRVTIRKESLIDSISATLGGESYSFDHEGTYIFDIGAAPKPAPAAAK